MKIFHSSPFHYSDHNEIMFNTIAFRYYIDKLAMLT
jgi:hypothetical protein